MGASIDRATAAGTTQRRSRVAWRSALARPWTPWTMVPQRPFNSARVSASAPIAAMPPDASTKRHAACTLGPIEPAAKGRRHRSSGVALPRRDRRPGRRSPLRPWRRCAAGCQLRRARRVRAARCSRAPRRSACGAARWEWWPVQRRWRSSLWRSRQGAGASRLARWCPGLMRTTSHARWHRSRPVMSQALRSSCRRPRP
jgi:hypothetical protein